MMEPQVIYLLLAIGTFIFHFVIHPYWCEFLHGVMSDGYTLSSRIGESLLWALILPLYWMIIGLILLAFVLSFLSAWIDGEL